MSSCVFDSRVNFELQMGVQPDKFWGVEKSPSVMPGGAPFVPAALQLNQRRAFGIFP
jgi:hypothetical protein